MAMVVEDNALLRENIVEVLSTAGYNAVGAENGADALELLREMPSKPDVIVLDLMMPQMSGWRFRDVQLANPSLSSIPVVIVSGLDESALPGAPSLPKPVRIDKLLETIAGLIPAGS
jgi:CheY-like chemotaxis protein